MTPKKTSSRHYLPFGIDFLKCYCFSMGANCLANIQATEAPLATSGVFERGNDDTKAFTKYGGIRSHVRTTTEVESKISNISDVTLPSIVDENQDMQSQ
uniref:Uncharacterized protein n=2 Tax=Salix viminalis TaxID=40686 RepID=A0A6N2KKP6_SALVM